jgi:hypothetical protein
VVQFQNLDGAGESIPLTDFAVAREATLERLADRIAVARNREGLVDGRLDPDARVADADIQTRPLREELGAVKLSGCRQFCVVGRTEYTS